MEGDLASMRGAEARGQPSINGGRLCLFVTKVNLMRLLGDVKLLV